MQPVLTKWPTSFQPLGKVEGVGCREETVYKYMGENVSVKLMESISGGGKSEACGHNHS